MSVCCGPGSKTEIPQPWEGVEVAVRVRAERSEASWWGSTCKCACGFKARLGGCSICALDTMPSNTEQRIS